MRRLVSDKTLEIPSGDRGFLGVVENSCTSTFSLESESIRDKMSGVSAVDIFQRLESQACRDNAEQFSTARVANACPIMDKLDN